MDLSRNIILEIDLDTGRISTTANNYFYNTDKNIAYFYIKLYRTNLAGEKQYIGNTNSSQYKVYVTTIKPKTITPIKLSAERITNSDIDENIVYKITIPNELMKQEGSVYCEGHIIYNKQELTTDCFSFKVNADKLTEYNLTLITDPDLPILQDLINQVKHDVRGIDDSKISDTTVWSSQYTNTKFTEVDSKIKDVKNRVTYSMPIKGQVFGHRGINDYAPENTLVGIQTAHQFGYKSIEVDIQRTSDNYWILMHDQVVDRTTTGTGLVRELTLEQIQTYKIDVGSNLDKYNQVDLRVPTLKQVLTECKKLDMTIMLDVKSTLSDSQAVDLINVIKSEGCMDRVIFSCYLQPAKLKALRKADSSVWLDYTPTTFNQDAIDVIKEVYPCTIDLDGTSTNTKIAEEVKLALDNGIEVLAWTVDDVDRINYLISLGVKSVITNRTFIGGGK